MTNKGGGGPAFPSFRIGTHFNGEKVNVHGMTLRDWFAGQALAGILSNTQHIGLVDAWADISYNFADAMLKEREK